MLFVDGNKRKGLDWGYESDLWGVGCILVELLTGELLFPTHADLEHLALMEHVLEDTLPPAMCHKAIEPFLKERKYRRELERSALSSSCEVIYPDSFWFRCCSSECTMDIRLILARGHARTRITLLPHLLLLQQPLPPLRLFPHCRDRHRRITIATTGMCCAVSFRPVCSSMCCAFLCGSSSRADCLFHLSTGRLRWPDGAHDQESIDHVAQTPKLKQLVPDPQMYDLISKLLRFDPAQRLKAADALRHPFFEPFLLNHPVVPSAPSPSSSSSPRASSPHAGSSPHASFFP